MSFCDTQTLRELSGTFQALHVTNAVGAHTSVRLVHQHRAHTWMGVLMAARSACPFLLHSSDLRQNETHMPSNISYRSTSHDLVGGADRQHVLNISVIRVHTTCCCQQKGMRWRCTPGCRAKKRPETSEHTLWLKLQVPFVPHIQTTRRYSFQKTHLISGRGRCLPSMVDTNGVPTAQRA